MQRQAQEMEQIKHENTEKMLLDEQKNFMFMVQKSAGVVKVSVAEKGSEINLLLESI